VRILAVPADSIMFPGPSQGSMAPGSVSTAPPGNRLQAMAPLADDSRVDDHATKLLVRPGPPACSIKCENHQLSRSDNSSEG